MIFVLTIIVLAVLQVWGQADKGPQHHKHVAVGFFNAQYLYRNVRNIQTMKISGWAFHELHKKLRSDVIQSVKFKW